MWSLLSLLILLSTVVADDFVLPQLNYNITTSVVWKCSLSSILDNAHFTVLYHDEHYQYVITSKEKQLSKCTLYADMGHALSQVNEITTTLLNNHRMKRDINHPDWFQSYHNLSTIYNWYEQLAHTYSSRVSVTTVGNTLYNRHLLAVHVNKGQTNKPVIYIQCLLHPREWISGPVCMSIAQLLASADHTNNIVFNLLDTVQFIILPVANPDGYYLTWVDYPKYRFWRKNLSKNHASSCLGVDLNRNFNIKWSKYGSSSNPCSDTYEGTRAESELEVKAISQYLLNYPQPIIGAIDIHSFSQAVIYPHAWTTTPPPNERLLKYIAQWTASTANQIGNQYKVEQMSSLYLASGTFTDWLLSDVFVNKNTDSMGQRYNPFPLTVELPPTGSHPVNGFMVPPEQIPSICSEMTPAIIKFASLVASNKNTAMVQVF